MKKRLSLLMVLMMVLSLVPMSAFATAGSMPGGVVSVEDNETVVKKVTVKLTQAAYDDLKAGQSQLTLSGAEFATSVKIDGVTTDYRPLNKVLFNTNDANAVAATTGTIEVTPDVILSDVATVNVPAMDLNSDSMDIIMELHILFDEADAGDVTLAVDEVGTTGLKVADPIKVAVVKEAKSTDLNLVVTDSAKKISLDGGELSRIEIKGFDKSSPATKSFKLELPEYLKWNAGTEIIGIGGTAAKSTDFGSDVLEITVTAGTKSVIIKPNVTVVRRDASMGDVNLKVVSRDGDGKQIDSTIEVIGQVADYDVTMTAVEKGKKEIPSIYGNETAKIKVTLSGVAGSFTNNRTIDFTIEGADVKGGSIVAKNALSGTVLGTVKENVYKDGEFTLTLSEDATTKKSVEFEMEVVTDYAHNGEVVLTAEGRDFGTLECNVAKVTPAFTVEVANVTNIKKGESLATADIVIKEAKAGILDSEDYLVLNLNDKNRETLSFASDYTVEGTNGLKLGDAIYNENGGSKNALSTLVIDVKSTSVKEAGVITISDVVVNVDGATVDGVKTLDVYVVSNNDEYAATSGSLKVTDKKTAVEYIDEEEPDAEYEVNYVNVVKEYGTVATTTVFVIGSKTYTVNGVQMTANEAPYVAGKGYTMLPVRALAESLGLKADWNSNTKTATFSNDSKVASVTLGADTMYVNGTPIPLNAKAEIKNGSTFIELRSLASAFGVELQWDAATKTVTIVG